MAYPGCPKLTDKRFCEEHEKLSNSNYERYGRDKSTKKRYGRAWKRIRDKYAAEHPFCELCFERGIIVPTEEIPPQAAFAFTWGGKQDRIKLIGCLEKTKVARYHSLAADPATLPDVLKVTARTSDGEVMAVAHRDLPVYGVQFHLESILTPEGRTMLKNFLNLRKEGTL